MSFPFRILLLFLLLSPIPAGAVTPETDPMGCAERFRLQSGTETAFVVTGEGEIVAASGAVETLLGFSASELVGKPFTNLAPAGRAEELRKFLATGNFPAPELLPLRLARKNGSAIDTEVVSGDILNPPDGWRVFLLRAARSHGTTNPFAQVVLDALPFNLAIMDAAGKILAVNEGWRRFGRVNGYLTATHGVGDNYLSACECPDQRGRLTGVYLRETLGGTRETFHLVYPCHSPRERKWFIVSGSRFEVEGLPRVLVIHQDVTESKLMEERLRDAERAEIIGRLVGGFAHHFNNILTVVGGNLELALQHLSSDHPAWAFANASRSSSVRAAALILELQRLSRARREANEPMHISRDILELVRGRPEPPAGVRYSASADSDDLWTEGNRDEVHSAIIRLLDNSVAAMSGRIGVIRILATKFTVTGAMIDLGLPPGEHVRIGVIDEGVGMDEDFQRRLFQPFFTTQPTSDQPRGLGLASAQGIVRAHGGIIRVTSASGVGTTMDIYLPAIPKPVAHTPRPPRPPTTGPIKVLLVDDDAGVRGVTAFMLRALNYEVVPASSGAEALEVRGAAVVLTDMFMPGMTGVELAKKLLERNPAEKIVLFAGDVDGAKTALDSAGISIRLLGKPFSPGQLDTALKAALE